MSVSALSEALLWLTSAAEQGDAAALHAIGEIHAERRIDEASPVEAAAYFVAAARAGSEQSLERALVLIDSLSAADTARAHTRSSEIAAPLRR